MADRSGISWLAAPGERPGATWQVLAGCTACSPGCTGCYSCRLLATRHAHLPWTRGLAEMVDGEPRWTSKVVLRPDQLAWVKTKRKSLRIFVADRGDIYHPGVPFEYADRVFAWMASCSRHTFLVLTKRVDRMLEHAQRIVDGGKVAGPAYEQLRREHFEKYKREFTAGYSLPEPPTPELRFLYDSAVVSEQGKPKDAVDFDNRGFSGGECHWGEWPLSNVWMGTSVCVAAEKYKIDQLRQVPAAHRFLSLEPCLEDLGTLDLTGIDWVILGGESGPKARPLHPQWARNVRDQCVAAGVPFFFKQWGQWSPIDEPWKQGSPKEPSSKERWCNLAGGHGFHGEDVWRMRSVGAKYSGHLLDGKEWRQLPWGAR